MTISDDLKLYLQERRRMLLSEVASIERMMGLEVRQSRQRVEAEPRFIVVDNVPVDQEVMRRG